MLVRLFRSGRPQSLALVLVVILSLKVPGWIFGGRSTQNAFEGWPSWWQSGMQLPLLPEAISLLSTVLAAFYVNGMVNRHGLLPRNNYLPMLCFGLFFSAFPEVQVAHPLHLAIFPLLYALDLILGFPRRESVSTAFDSAFWIGVAAWIYGPLVWVFPLPVIGLLLFRAVRWRAYLWVVVGLLLPTLFRAAFLYVTTGRWDAGWPGIEALPVLFPSGWMERSLPVLYLLLPVLVTMGSFLKGMRVNTVRIRRSYLFLVWWVVISGLSLLHPQCGGTHFILTAAPGLALVFANYLYHAQRMFWAHAILIAFWGIALYAQFSY